MCWTNEKIIMKTKLWANIIAGILYFGVVLIILKHLGFTQLSWFWVLSPFWGLIGVVLGIIIICMLILIIITLIAEYQRNKS